MPILVTKAVPKTTGLLTLILLGPIKTMTVGSKALKSASYTLTPLTSASIFLFYSSPL